MSERFVQSLPFVVYWEKRTDGLWANRWQEDERRAKEKADNEAKTIEEGNEAKKDQEEEERQKADCERQNEKISDQDENEELEMAPSECAI